MYRTVSVASFALLVGCAATGVQTPSELASDPQADPAGANLSSLTHIEDVDVAEAARPDGYVCVREATTGTRIETERCYFVSAERDAQLEAEAQELLEYLRAQEMWNELGERQRQQNAMRRAMGGGGVR